MLDRQTVLFYVKLDAVLDVLRFLGSNVVSTMTDMQMNPDIRLPNFPMNTVTEVEQLNVRLEDRTIIVRVEAILEYIVLDDLALKYS